ncbi:hypothetical protein [Micromonospora sp. NPDC049645]|uniref:hypothetical protein n=1 Tax=Micromonospora sp. NPDC049645 TaxID=3155508 RepID=UPI00341EE183
MTVRRLGAGLVAAALITPALAACASGTGTTGSTPSPTVSASGTASPSGAPVAGDAKQALLDSTKEISNGNFRFTLAGAGSTVDGLVHQPSQSAAMKISIGGPSADLAMKLDVIHYKPDSWVKLELSGPTANSLPAIKQLNLGKYQHLDQARIKGNRNLGFDFEKVDPAGSAVLTEGITEVRSTGTGAYAGTIDVTKAAEAGSLNAATIAALGTQAKTVPFTAKVDPQGRLSELVLQLPAAGQTTAQEIRMTYSDYGAATAAQKPPANQVVEAPAELYSLFN